MYAKERERFAQENAIWPCRGQVLFVSFDVNCGMKLRCQPPKQAKATPAKPLPITLAGPGARGWAVIGMCFDGRPP